MAAAATASRDAGYETTICFSEVARGRSWLPALSGLADIDFIDTTGIRDEIRQLQQVVRRSDSRPTILHTHFGEFDLAAAFVARTRRRTAVLWHAHSGTTRKIRMRSQIAGAIFGEIVNGIVCVGPAMYREMLARRVPKRKLRLLPNAVDTARFMPVTDEERRAARISLQLPAYATVVLHFAWGWDIKGGDLLLETAERMPPDREVTFLSVLGEDGGGAPQGRIAQYGNVRTAAPRADVNELYAAADVYLNCSRAEGGLPFAVLEALARGLPVVVTDPPVAAELVSGLPGGRAVPRTPDALVGALAEVLALTSSEREQHVAAARARVAATYSLEQWAQRLVAIYDEALGQRKRV